MGYSGPKQTFSKGAVCSWAGYFLIILFKAPVDLSK